MGNENERKHNPAESREEWMGGGPDSSKKGGGDESNVGLTGSAGGEGGMGAGSGGVIGGSADFLTDEQPTAALGGQNSHESEYGAQHSGTGQQSFGNQQNVTDQQGGDTNFGGRTGSGSSFIASDSGQSDLGSAGIGEAGADGESTMGSQESFGQSDQQGAGFMAQQGTGSDDVRQDNEGQGDLASKDALDTGEDGGAGVEGGQSR